MPDTNNRLNSQRRSLFHELPYFGQNISLAHGQFNNCLACHLPSKKYLETLCSIYDLDLFSLNTGEAHNPDFNRIGVSETKINSLKDVDFDPSIPGYVFEHVPTPLASGGVGLYINGSLKYRVIEKTSEKAFQALWIEIQFPRKSNIICGIIYRQHNSPPTLSGVFDLTLEKLTRSR